MSSMPALELRNLRKRFGQTEIIRGANLVVRPGERMALIGPNGAGKSTLFNLISGRMAPDSGEVLLGGRRIDGMRPHQIHRLGLSRSFQITHVFARLSVFDNLRCGVLWSLGYRYTLFRLLSRLHDANARTEDLLRQLGLQHKRDVLAMNLTYAEQRALELGITIAGGSPVVLLDEPTAGMSRSETTRFTELIREVTQGKTLLTVEHDMSVVFGLADRVAVLVQGQVLACDTPEAVRADPRVQEAYLGQGSISVLTEPTPTVRAEPFDQLRTGSVEVLASPHGKSPSTSSGRTGGGSDRTEPTPSIQAEPTPSIQAEPTPTVRAEPVEAPASTPGEKKN